MRHILLILLISFTIVACGTKGDLYIPEQQYPQPAEEPAR
ncbi:MAG TPA: lipoprotein [Methylophilaceae bacterium]|nr:lipoprotein [Methylophilaceae bacterium]